MLTGTFERVRRSTIALAFAASSVAAIGWNSPMSTGQSRDGVDSPRHVAKGADGARLAAAIDSLERIELSGAVLAARDGKVLAAIGLGHADLDGKVANDANTLFEIASASKQFTAAAILRLVAKKKLALDDPISKHLPAVPENCRAITVRHLLQHTSGIPGTNSRGGGTDLAAIVPVFLTGGPQHEPGTHFEYWNQGYALLAGIVEHVSGDSFVEFSTDEVFAPAKLTNTTFNGGTVDTKAKSKPVVAIGRSSYGEPRSALEHPYGQFGYQYRGMGGVVTNVWDLWRWDRALAAAKIVDKKHQVELFRPGLQDYALGWYVEEQSGRTVQRHSGSVRGFVADVRRYPDADGCLFVLCNNDAMPLHQAVAFIETALFDGDVVLPPHPLTAEAAAPLLGTYEDERGTKLIIDRRGSTTHATLEWPAGQRTAAYLGLDDDNQLVLWDWREHHAISANEDDSLTTLGARFRHAP